MWLLWSSCSLSKLFNCMLLLFTLRHLLMCAFRVKIPTTFGLCQKRFILFHFCSSFYYPCFILQEIERDIIVHVLLNCETDIVHHCMFYKWLKVLKCVCLLPEFLCLRHFLQHFNKVYWVSTGFAVLTWGCEPLYLGCSFSMASRASSLVHLGQLPGPISLLANLPNSRISCQSSSVT